MEIVMSKKKGLLLSIDDDQHKRLKVYAATQCKSMKAVIIEWLEDAIKEQESRKTDSLSAQ
jgi:plasmid stability protein